MPWLKLNSVLYLIFVAIIIYDFHKYYTTTTASIYELGFNAFFGVMSALCFFAISKNSGRLFKAKGLIDLVLMGVVAFVAHVVVFFVFIENII